MRPLPEEKGELGERADLDSPSLNFLALRFFF